MATETRQNWAGNYTYQAVRWHQPASLAELQEVVAGSRKLRVVGSRHSFNSIADSAEDLVSLDRLPEEIVIDPERRRVTVGGGVTYGRLAQELNGAGFALHNMASLPHISVAGACATGTHGSGHRNGNLATAVTAVEVVTADGSLRTFSRDTDGSSFAGVPVALGGLGVVHRLTLEVLPSFWVQQEVYEGLRLREVLRRFRGVFDSCYSPSYFTTWQPSNAGVVGDFWMKQTLRGTEGFPSAPLYFGASRAQAPRHPIADLSAESCTMQLGIPGPWHERLPHFRPEFNPSSSAELQSEYFVPRAFASLAIWAIAELAPQFEGLLQISEIRTVAADWLWMSPCFERDSIGIHFTWKKDWPRVREVLPQIEARLELYEPRPHWGKLFTMRPEQVRSRYRKLPEFRALLRTHDPTGKYRNDFLDTYVFGDI
jgi:xylitol oxidase